MVANIIRMGYPSHVSNMTINLGIPLLGRENIHAVRSTPIVGGCDQLFTLDVDVWEDLMHEGTEPPQFYDDASEFLASDYLQRY
jgi:hypothetical protein